MITFSVKVKSVQFIPELKLTPKQDRQIGKTAINSLVNRVQQDHTDVYDSQMPAYSPKPIYVKVGMQGGQAVLKSGRITIASLSSLRKRGVKIIDIRGGSNGKKFKNSVVRTGNSIRFPNRAAYKKFLGKSGNRDLTETGKMLGALVITSITGIYAKVITIGFKDLKQAKKAGGNAAITDWMGLSPSDQSRIFRLVNGMIEDNLKLPASFSGQKSYTTVS